MLVVKQLSFSYDKINILDDISFSIDQGQLLTILGPNGSGKTTLINCILGLNHIELGTIQYQGQDVKDYHPKKRASLFSYVPQDKGNSFPYTVLEIVMMGRTPYHSIFSSPDEQDRIIALEALDLVGLTGFQDRLFTKLSGGERQLVILARALAQQAEVIIMDEPTASLDLKNEFMILEVIGRLCQDESKTIIMTTHFPNHSFYFENNGLNTIIAALSEKRIKYFGRPCEVLTEENIYDIYHLQSKVIHYDETKKHIIPIGGQYENQE